MCMVGAPKFHDVVQRNFQKRTLLAVHSVEVAEHEQRQGYVCQCERTATERRQHTGTGKASHVRVDNAQNALMGNDQDRITCAFDLMNDGIQT